MQTPPKICEMAGHMLAAEAGWLLQLLGLRPDEGHTGGQASQPTGGGGSLLR